MLVYVPSLSNKCQLVVLMVWARDSNPAGDRDRRTIIPGEGNAIMGNGKLNMISNY